MELHLEIRFECQVAKSGYKFDDDGFVRPIDRGRGFIQKPLEEIAVFEFLELLSALDEGYQTGLPSKREQSEIIRFYNRWGFLEWYDRDSEMAPWLLRAMAENFETRAGAPSQIKIEADASNSSIVFGEIELLRHALWIAKTKADEAKYTVCEYLTRCGQPRIRRKGTCPPKCRVKINGPSSWGNGCQQVYDNQRRRGTLGKNKTKDK